MPEDTPIKFYIEVGRADGEAFAQGHDDRFVEATTERLQQVSRIIEHSCMAFVDKIKELPVKPASLGLEFGVTVSGKAGVPFITEGSLSGNFKVNLAWDFK